MGQPEQVDISRVVEDAFKTMANAVLLTTIQTKFGEQVHGATGSVG
jgi:hypothetical protein